MKKAQAKVVKCAKNKSWVPRNPPLGHLSVKVLKPMTFRGLRPLDPQDDGVWRHIKDFLKGIFVQKRSSGTCFDHGQFEIPYLRPAL